MSLLAGLRAQWDGDRERLALWTPAALMLGIGSYFSLPDEPPVYAGGVLLAFAAALLAVAWRSGKRSWAMPLLLIALGFAAAQLRAHLVATPLLTQELKFREIEGTIDEIEPAEKRVKLVLSYPGIAGVAPQDTPLRLRVSFKDDGANRKVGDRVRLYATLFPLPAPVMPGAFDFARHFYFRSIGGNGFAFRPPEPVESAAQSDFHSALGNLRHRIGEDMRRAMPGDAGAIAAALTIGEDGPISEEAKQQLRDAGLAHVLSISGLHLAIAAGLVFFNIRLLLALSPTLALRLPIKKIAAAGALLGAFAYLQLAGSPVPAQRSFIMAAVVFLGYILDRQSISLRTLMLAACFVLLLFPEAMFGASFQLSFAATLAIVALAETFGARLSAGSGGTGQKLLRYGLGIAGTSLAATLATAPFILYDFNRFASFGLLSNMVVIPLASFVIMPGVVLALLFMPLDLQWIGYVPLQYGIGWMMKMAQLVTSLPYASPTFPSPTDAGLLACAFGLLWLCLMKERWWLLGAPLMIAGLATMALHEPPDLLISRDARQVMARLPDGNYTLLKGTARSFVAKNWLRSEGQEEAVPLKESGIECEDGLCIYRNGERRALFFKEPEDEVALQSACAGKSDLLIVWRALDATTCPGPARLIGERELRQYGAHAVRFAKSGMRIERTRSRPGQRLWQLPFAIEEISEE